jgi:hypothetical protein
VGKIRSYTKIWKVEKIIYSLQDFNLPFPLTFTQISMIVLFFMAILLFKKVPPLSLISSEIIRQWVLPIVLGYFLGTKGFEGKSPLAFLRSVFLYLISNKKKYAGKRVKDSEKYSIDGCITAVRSELYVPAEVSDKVY